MSPNQFFQLVVTILAMLMEMQFEYIALISIVLAVAIKRMFQVQEETGNPIERDDDDEEEEDIHQPHVQETQPPAGNNREHQRNPINAHVLAMIEHVLAFQRRLERERMEDDIQKREENRRRREEEDLELRRNMMEERERLERENKIRREKDLELRRNMMEER